MPIVSKRIAGPVGRLGINLPGDVKVVKYLLNTVPEQSGGPPGVILEATPMSEVIGHIERFQKRNIGFADGRVDVEGRTLQKLREFDPTPDQPPFVPTVLSGKKRTGKKGGR